MSLHRDCVLVLINSVWNRILQTKYFCVSQYEEKLHRIAPVEEEGVMWRGSHLIDILTLILTTTERRGE